MIWVYALIVILIWQLAFVIVRLREIQLTVAHVAEAMGRLSAQLLQARVRSDDAEEESASASHLEFIAAALDEVLPIEIGETDIVVPAREFDIDGETTTLLRWCKRTGDTVRRGETIVEIEDVVLPMAIRAPHAGELLTRAVHEGAIVRTGQVLARIRGPRFVRLRLDSVR